MPSAQRHPLRQLLFERIHRVSTSRPANVGTTFRSARTPVMRQRGIDRTTRPKTSKTPSKEFFASRRKQRSKRRRKSRPTRRVMTLFSLTRGVILIGRFDQSPSCFPFFRCISRSCAPFLFKFGAFDSSRRLLSVSLVFLRVWHRLHAVFLLFSLFLALATWWPAT